MEISPQDQSLIDAVCSGDIRQSARLITRIENNDPDVIPLLQRLYLRGGQAQVLGITGPPGAGKSTLVNKLIGEYRQLGSTVAVLAVDPSSPFSGGAILGDRVRMGQHHTDEGVFIRSMAARGHLGGLSKATGDALTVLDAMGWDVVIVETVGVGQSEVEIVRHADTVVLLQTAGFGDDVQAIKAGIMEIADIYVVNKADLGDVDKIVASIQALLQKQGDVEAWQPQVVKTQASNGKGVAELLDLVAQHNVFLSEYPAFAKQQRKHRIRHRLLEICFHETARQVFSAEQSSYFEMQLDAVAARKIDPYSVAAEINPVSLKGTNPTHSSGEID